jgi:hypothetical protein
MRRCGRVMVTLGGENVAAGTFSTATRERAQGFDRAACKPSQLSGVETESVGFEGRRSSTSR